MTKHFAIRLQAIALLLAACGGQLNIGPDGTTDGGANGMGNGLVQPAPPAPLPPPPPAPVYKRGSLDPLYQLVPRAEYGRIAQAGTAMSDADLQAAGVVVSVATKLDELGAQLQRERSAPAPIDLIPALADRQRASQIPFRGNPSDVKFVRSGDTTKLYVPLGGDVMAPGNELAVVSVQGGNATLRTRLKVGLRPLRVAVHPGGLIFVCNEYSNYISVIDPATDQPLMQGSTPVEIKTEFYCTDLALVPRTPRAPNSDQQFLYVANRWRHSVLKYQADIVRDPLSNRAVGVVQTLEKNPQPANRPLTEILGVGANPWRLTTSDQQDALYVAGNKGGELARIDLHSDTVSRRISIGAPSADVVAVADLLFVPTTTPYRGLLAQDDVHPQPVLGPPISVVGVDGQMHLAHPGALFDGTRSYNFEDVRNGLLQLDFQLQPGVQAVYYTDDVSPEPNFIAQQKVIAGAIPQSIVRSAAGDLVYLALGGSDLVQELRIAGRPYAVQPSRVFQTGHRPFGLALDERANRLYVTDWGGETVEVIDLGSGSRVAQVDLGYAQPAYPATAVEQGELFFYSAAWSNNGRKACASCHFDELDTDGVGYSNGAQAPTSFHEVKPNHNLMTTNGYFWNGSFGDGNYTSLAFAAQTRTNCELILFGLIEGPGSNPAVRVGDPNNVIRNGDDASCRPVLGNPQDLPSNFDQITQIIAAQKQIGQQHITAATGLDAVTLSRVIDAYSVSELRLPPDPLAQTYRSGDAHPEVRAQIDQGRALFMSAGCDSCHRSSVDRHPFTDGLNHGRGADWVGRFVATYMNDARITGPIGAFSQTLLDAVAPSRSDHEVNLYYDALDSFTPFCFDQTHCLQFLDPLAVRGNATEESRRLDLLVRFNLADRDRQFIPGNVLGQPQTNTPSLRGVWTQANLLHHGLAHTLREAVLAPGHAALQPGESGFAVDALGNFDVHGATRGLSADEVNALLRFVESIE